MPRDNDSTIQETHFFRNPRQYEWLAERLPGWLSRRGALKVWSAGCSSGAELYSLLILLEELGLLGEHVELLGTDRDPEAVARARRARFTEWELRGLSEERRARFFGSCGTLDPELASRASFEAADLLSDPGPQDCDLTLCRNVLIYYRPVQVRAIMASLAGSLHTEGILLLGYAEAPQALVADQLRLEDAPAAAFRRREEEAASPPPEPLAPAEVPKAPKAAVPPNESRLRKALNLLDRDQTRLAMQELRRLVYEDRRHAAGHYYLGLVWRTEGEEARASRHFRTALEQLEKEPAPNPVEDLQLTTGELATLARWQLNWPVDPGEGSDA